MSDSVGVPSLVARGDGLAQHSRPPSTNWDIYGGDDTSDSEREAEVAMAELNAQCTTPWEDDVGCDTSSLSPMSGSTSDDEPARKRKKTIDPGLQLIAESMQGLAESSSKKRLNEAQTAVAESQLRLNNSQRDHERTQTLALQLSIMKDVGASQEALKRRVIQFGLDIDTAV